MHVHSILQLALIVFLLLSSFLAHSLNASIVLAAAATLTMCGVLYIRIQKHIRNNHRAQQKGMDTLYSQIEAHATLLHTLNPTHPLPPMQGWSAAPDFLRMLMENTFQYKPNTIVELGSGTSTLILAYTLKKIGKGRIISLEHDKIYADQTRQCLFEHDLDQWVTIIHAPLKQHTIGTEYWQWHDLSGIHTRDLSIDMLVVDGPPGILQPLARYPALPLLNRFLSADACVIMDDFERADEQEIQKRWLKEFTDFQVKELSLKKGACILKRTCPTHHKSEQLIR